MTSRDCLSCGAPTVVAHREVTDPQSREVFSLIRCTDCGLGQTEPIPDDIGRYYGAAYHGGRHGSTAQFRARRRVSLVESALGSSLSGKRVLDIGCGDGTFLLATAARGAVVAGTEYSPDLARSQGLTVYGSLDEIPSDEKFDAITMWHTLEHMVDPRVDVAYARDHVSPDGVFVVAVPNAGGLQARFSGRYWFHLDVPRHLFHFSDRSLRTMLSRHDFSVHKRWDMEAEYDLMGWSQSMLNSTGKEPNAFFDILRGKATTLSSSGRALQLAAGVATTAVALPLVAAGTALKQGGTLIFAAKRHGASAAARNGG